MESITLAFLGKYRPLYLEAETRGEVVSKALKAVENCPMDYRTFTFNAVCDINGTGYAAISREDGHYAVSWRNSGLDDFAKRLDRVCHEFPPMPGLDYSEGAFGAFVNEPRDYALLHGFSEEIGGGGSNFLSRYFGKAGYVWITGKDGGQGMPQNDDWCICAYPSDWDGDAPLCDHRSDEESPLSFADALSAAFALVGGN